MITDEEFNILNFLDIYSSGSSIDRIQIGTGLDFDRLASILQEGLDKKLVEKKGDTWGITPEGVKEVQSYRKSTLTQPEAIGKIYHEFDKLNDKFKKLVTRWQIRNFGGTSVPNVHDDPEYDFGIICDLSDIHDEVVRIFGELTKIIPRYKHYVERMGSALEKIKKEKHGYLVENKESYHNIWFELHEDLLRLLGKRRDE